MQTTIIDNATDGRIHIVASEGGCYVYLRDTDIPGVKTPPEWLAEAGKVKSWADGRSKKTAERVFQRLREARLMWETRNVAPGVYGLAVYSPNDATQRRVTLAALLGVRETG